MNNIRNTLDRSAAGARDIWAKLYKPLSIQVHLSKFVKKEHIDFYLQNIFSFECNNYVSYVT